MFLNDWIVKYSSSPVTLTDVQNIVIQKGRVQITDPFKASTATITGRNVAALPAIEIGVPISISYDDPGFLFPREVFSGVVADVQIVFGFVSSMDTWTIQCEDALATAGRSFTTDTFSFAAGLPAFTAGQQTMTNAFSGAVVLVGNPGSTSTVSAQSKPDTNVLQLLNELAATEQGYLSSRQTDAIRFLNRADYVSEPLLGDFTDGSLVSLNTEAFYDNVIFRSQADSFFDKVIVEPDGLAPQTAGTGSRVFTVKTFDQTTTQAKNLADYILATLQVQQSVPSTVSALLQVQTNTILFTFFLFVQEGGRVGLILRGVQYQLFLEGATVTATPNETRFSFNVVSSEAIVGFILDSSTLGVLDQNKLGF